MSNYHLSDLLDLKILQKMSDALFNATGIPFGIIDAIDNSILAGTGWEDICVKFHRANPVSCQRCIESDNFIKSRLIEGEACYYKCKNGLWDIGTPIIVAGKHLATLFIGQFFYEDEIPDRDFFIKLANEFNYNVDDYMSALDNVRTFTHDEIQHIVDYHKILATFIANLAAHEIKRIENELNIKQQAEFFQLMLDTIPIPVFYKDRQGRYLGCNRSFEQFYGMSRDELAGKTVYQIALKEYADIYFKADNDLFEHPGTQIYESSFQSTDGLMHDVIFHKATFNGPDGSVAGLLGAIVDITERKKAEKENQRLQDQLVSAQKMESIGQLAGGVAHDFNNMLSIIIGNAELALLDLDPNEPIFQKIKEIQKAAERSADLTQKLLAFARRQIIAPKVLDLNLTIEAILTMLQRLIGEDVVLAWIPCKDIWNIKVDPAQIDQILMNLVANARDSIIGGGKISIETRNVSTDETFFTSHLDAVLNEYVMLEISDNGIGMEKDVVANIFEPFYTTKKKGTGFGLSTVYGIVKQNNGLINVYSEPGVGTTFKIYFPRHMGNTEYRMKKSTALATKGSETVLLVEDEIMVLTIAQTMLQQLGYTVLAANTPGEAIKIAEEHTGKIHLLITDTIMPEMNGRDLANRLVSRYPNLKHLFMSGYTANVIAHHGVLKKGVHFIQKPFLINNLAAKVREILDT